MRNVDPGRARRAPLRSLAGLAALGATLAAAPAAAWECTGVPSSVAFARIEYDDVENLTATVGVGPVIDGHSALSVNAVRFKDPPNGSKLTSVGFRFIYSTGPTDQRRFNACMLLGLQLGRAWLVNADGLRANARLETRILPLGMGFSYRLGSPHLGVIAFTVPQVRLVSHDTKLYDRTSQQDLSDSPTQYGAAFGATAMAGPVFARATLDWTRDQPRGWSLSLGVGW